MISRMEYVGRVRISSVMHRSVCHELPNVRVVRRKRQMRRARIRKPCELCKSHVERRICTVSNGHFFLRDLRVLHDLYG